MKNFRTWEQDLSELNITDTEYNNIISNLYDLSENEMIKLAKALKEGEGLKSVKYAFERVLNMRYTERRDVYNYYFG